MLLCATLLFSVNLFAKDVHAKKSVKVQPPINQSCYGPQGWIFDLGGQYTWVDFYNENSNSGSTGGIIEKITYQRPKSFYGQLRSVLNLGTTTPYLDYDYTYTEWYGEYVSGYCFGIKSNWMITPYGGIGVDALNQRAKGEPSFPTNNYYQTYYLLFGCEARYAIENWYFALQADGLPVAEQYLTIGDSNHTTYKLKQGIGAAVRLSAARRLGKHFWLELTPYYKYFPIGKKDSASLPTRNLNQVGFFLTLRYAI